ncbi:ABC transporter ATP-binding protein [Arthrobacter sp. ISL-69]|uniref:ABC transporter ATP-binding protein n=1 Tax=Arthrobacter sp. ISL-69 TaxID=2819113 RepID=UPI001BE72F23|nr:ABC transporter ATP-binding protein [Arthrobacter sp. ISL-69]MBT2536265.1 ABC transporter ATP-binding protein [Arthrobacter sp. ISL-69]
MEAHNIDASIGRNQVLYDVSLSVKAGEILVMLGPNGAGKSTFVQVAAGLHFPDTGIVRVGGQDIFSPAGGRLARQKLGVARQELTLEPRLTARETLELSCALTHIPRRTRAKRVRYLLDAFNLGSSADIPNARLSGGMKRKLDLAASLAAEPELILLDEPTNGVDVGARDVLWTLLRDLVYSGTAVLLTTHHLEEASVLADRAVFLRSGRIIAEGSLDIMRSLIGTRTLTGSAQPSELFGFRDALITKGVSDSHVQVLGSEVQVTDATTTTMNLVLQAATELGVEFQSLRLEAPSLDQVFLTLSEEEESKRSA